MIFSWLSLMIMARSSLAKIPLTTKEIHKYSFDEFLSDFDKTVTETQYEQRKKIFNANVERILQHNRNRQPHHHELGITSFTDVDDKDLPLGLVKPVKNKQEHTARSTVQRHLEISPVSSLPKSVDWRKEGVTTPVKSQGACGSCWAFATTAMLESHVAISTGVLYSLSTQELVSCMSNPRKCGGDGGCMGATAELAMDFLTSHGAVQEWSFGYQSFHGEKVNCTLHPKATKSRYLRSQNKTSEVYSGAVASITTWVSLPSNDYSTLMNAVAKLGPVAVSVAASPWSLYKGGIFYSPFETIRQTDVNHLVVLEGYGTDPDTGVDYWLVRNSWGPTWGENGYIRLKREEIPPCGMDTTPADGVACIVDDEGNPITPEPAEICGTSGILYDTSIPVGPYLI